MLSGQIAVRREIFYLPLFAGSLMASLIASRRTLPRWLRVLLGLAAIPRHWRCCLRPGPCLVGSPEFRLQTAALIVCLLMVPAVIVTRHLPDRLVLLLIAALAIPAAILPAWGFLQVRPAVAGLYRQPLIPGWGFWAELIGFLFVAFWAVTRRSPALPHAAVDASWRVSQRSG